MVALFIISFLTCFLVNGEETPSIYQKNDPKKSKDEIIVNNKLLAYSGSSDRNSEQYFVSLTKVLSAFEFDHSLRINPQKYNKIAIKVDTGLAPGLYTSKGLLDGVLKFLEIRGFEKKNVMIFDRDPDGLKAAGFLPYNGPNFYLGYEVLHSMVADYFMPGWFHDSPLPPTSFDRAKFILQFPSDSLRRSQEERRSYLPAILYKDAHWINLAVPMDDVFLGIDGAASNISFGAVSNQGRFLQKKTMAPATVTEILAIPEIWDKRLFSILDFSSYQVANGQRFDSKYIEKSPYFYLSENPFSLDYLAWKVVNKVRYERELSIRNLNSSLLFKYAQELGLGVPSNTILKNISP